MNQTFHRAFPPELREVDEINAWMYESNRDRPLADVLRACFAIQVARVHSLLSATLGCLPDLVCLGRMSLEEPIGFSVGNTFEIEEDL